MPPDSPVPPAPSDATTASNVKVLGEAPALAPGNLFQATSQALGLAALNATNAQQQGYVAMQATTTMGVSTLYSIDTASAGTAFAAFLKTVPPAPAP